jgi:predicted ABC-type sugar transport system permease subunit
MGVRQYWDGVAAGAVILIAAGIDLMVRQGAAMRLSRADV